MSQRHLLVHKLKKRRIYSTRSLNFSYFGETSTRNTINRKLSNKNDYYVHIFPSIEYS